MTATSTSPTGSVSPPVTHALDPAMLQQMARNTISTVWHGVAGSPILMIMVSMLAIGFVTRTVRRVAYPRGRRDPLRRFTRDDKKEILRRAGNRCEHHGWIDGRCGRTEGLEADHVIPWSRSGPTIIGNGQALCGRHNRAKSAHVPFRWQLRALERRRSDYFPDGTPGAVQRRKAPGAR